jgi:heat shock protein HtpX
MKRIFLFLAVNILVVATISILTSLLGIGSAPLMLFCFFWGMVGSLISLMLSTFMAKWMMGVQLVTLEGPHKPLVETVHRLARRAGLTRMPEVGIYQSPVLNAFATGPSRDNSLVAVSTGLMIAMDDKEIEGVLAHEVSHIANGDMVTMALIQGVVNAFVMFFSRIVAFALTQRMRGESDRRGPPNRLFQMMLIFILDVLFGLLAMPIVAAFSRYREFRADIGGADLAGKEKMIAALEALKLAYPQLVEGKHETNENFKSLQISSKATGLRLFSTHPPLEERLKRLINCPI